MDPDDMDAASIEQEAYAEGVADERARWEQWCADLGSYHQDGSGPLGDVPAVLVNLTNWLRVKDTMWEQEGDRYDAPLKENEWTAASLAQEEQNDDA